MDEEKSSSSSTANDDNETVSVTKKPTDFTSAFNDGLSDGEDSDDDDDILPPGMAAPQSPVNMLPNPDSLPGAPAGGGAMFHPLANLRAMDGRLQTLQETATARPPTPPELKKEEIDSEEEEYQDEEPEVETSAVAEEPEEGIAVISETVNKRGVDEGMGLKDELDFEEEIESGEEGELAEVVEVQDEEEEEELEKEDGEISDEEEANALLQNEPKTVCRFFNKGQCTWGTNCRFLHPGVSDKGNYNMFAPVGSAKDTTENKENETDKEEEKKEEKKEKVTVSGRPRFAPEPNMFETAWERGLRHAKDLIKRSHKRRETDADFEEKRFNLSLGQAELDRENDYYTRPASPVLKTIPLEVQEGFDPYDERQAIKHFRGGYFENFEVRYHVGPQGHGGPPPQGGREPMRDHPMVMGGPPTKPPHAAPMERGRKKHPQERRYPRSPGSNSGDDVGSPKGGEDWADPWARKGPEPKKEGAKKGRRSRSYSSGSHSSRSSSGSSHSSRSNSASSRSYSRSRSRSAEAAPPNNRPPFGGNKPPGYEAHYPPQQQGFFRGGPQHFRGRGGHFDGPPPQFFRGRGGRGFMRGNFRGRFPYNHHNNHGGPPGPYPPHGGFPGGPYGGPPGRGRYNRDGPDEGRVRDPRSGGMGGAPPGHNMGGPPPHEGMPPNRRFGNQPFHPHMEEARFGDGRRGRPSDPRLRDGEKHPSNPNEKVDAFGRMIRQPKRSGRAHRSRSPSSSHSRSGSSSSRSITPPQKQSGRRRRKYSLSASRSRSRSYSRSRSGSHSSRSHSSDSERGGVSKSGVKRGVRGAPVDPRMKNALPPTSIGFEARNNATRGKRNHHRSVSRSRSRSRSYSSSSSSSSSSGSEVMRRKRNPEDRPRVPINTLAAYTTGGNSTVPRYAAAQSDANKSAKPHIKMSMKNTSRVISNAPLANEDDDSGESDTGVNVLGKRKANSPAMGSQPAKSARTGGAPLSPGAAKKNRREELLRQLRDVEDLIAKKRGKV